MRYARIADFLTTPVAIYPLVSFRIAFGLLMLFSTLRYAYLGWIDTQLVDPLFHFSYFGFDFVEPLPRGGMYALFAFLAVASLGIALGWCYRFFTVGFFLGFTYVELIDLTYYLNHYYFVSLVAFLLIWVPANRYFSLDVLRRPSLRRTEVSRWCVDIFKFQIAVVYVYAGLAKLNYDWLIQALPLRIWLPAKTSLPIIGPLFGYEVTAYLFSWAGMLFDTFIIAALLYRPTRWLAYAAVVVFHLTTGLLFQIGIFPLVMIFTVTIFFSPQFHRHLLARLGSFFRPGYSPVILTNEVASPARRSRRFVPAVLLFVSFQLLFPWRYLLYDGNLFWNEEGYRFSWRVMLMEKAGTATFYVTDRATGREGAVVNRKFLNAHQEKQMAMQPDMILQFAHFLKEHYGARGMVDPAVRAEVEVTLNARPAQYLVDPTLDLTQFEDGWAGKEWIMPLTESTSR